MMADFSAETWMSERVEQHFFFFLTAKRKEKSLNSLLRKKYLQVCWQNKGVFQTKEE